MTGKDFGIPEETLTFFVVLRKSETSRNALDKNIRYEFVHLFLFFRLIPDSKVVSFQLPTILAPNFMSEENICYLFPGVYFQIQSKFYQIKINFRNKVHYFSLLYLHCTNICMKRRKHNSSSSSIHQHSFQNNI